MKKINKLMTLAITVMAIVSIQSCSKTAFQPANLVGTWNMTQEITSSTFVSEMPENIGTAAAIKLERTSELTSTPSGVTGTEETIKTYDPVGTGGLSSNSTETEYEVDELIETQTSVNSGVSSSVISSTDVISSKNYSITFNQDKTFTLTNNTEIVYSSDDSGVGYTVVFENAREGNISASGSWAFIGEDKNADEKNNERIGLWFTSQSGEYIDEYKETYTDTDAADGFDYTELSYVNLDEDTDVDNGSATEPDLVWKMVEGTNKEMTVTFTYQNNNTGENKNTYTDFTGTTATSSESENTSTGSTTITFTK